LAERVSAGAGFDQAIALDLKAASAWNHRYLILATSGALDGAASDCDEALRLVSENSAILDTRAALS
jgi:hypothetical protein